jgi:flagellar basal body-associated protein FliL
MPDDEQNLEEEIEPKKGFGLVAIIAIVVALLIGIVGGGLAAKMLLADEGGASAEDGEAGEVGGDDDLIDDLAAPDTEVIPVGSFTVNLRDSSGGRLLQLEIAVEGTPEAMVEVQNADAQIRDAVLLVASDYTYMDLEGMDGRMRLRDEIHRRINRVLDPHRVLRVYFTKIVVQ